jgi:hypothetical protein
MNTSNSRPVGESVLFESQGVLVTDSKLVAGRHCFPLHDLNSIKMETRRTSRGVAIFGFLFFTFIGLTGIAIMFTGGNGAISFVQGIAAILVATIFLIGAYRCWTSAEYEIVVASTSGDAKILTTEDQLVASRLLEIINKILANRH